MFNNFLFVSFSFWFTLEKRISTWKDSKILYQEEKKENLFIKLCDLYISFHLLIYNSTYLFIYWQTNMPINIYMNEYDKNVYIYIYKYVFTYIILVYKCFKLLLFLFKLIQRTCLRISWRFMKTTLEEWDKCTNGYNVIMP